MQIAVVTPSKSNRHELLQECIASVKAQTRPADIHAIEVDIHCMGPAKLRNKIVSELPDNIDWLAFLDDDDIMFPNHLEKLTAVAENADVVYSPSQYTGVVHALDLKKMRICNHIAITSLVRRSMFEQVGGFVDRRMEDWELWKKIVAAGGRFIFVPEQTWEYRIQPDSRQAKTSLATGQRVYKYEQGGSVTDWWSRRES
jgi:glycosyltransferase involved in cell wall biosynthesis